MKKELSLFLQFFSILVLAGYGFWGLMMLQDGTATLFWPAYKNFFINWISAFLVLASIRVAIVSLLTAPSIPGRDSGYQTRFLGTEIWVTVQYLITAAISILVSFLVPIFLTPKNISINIFELWRSLWQMYLAWICGFLMLSSIRIGIVYSRRSSRRA
jgi:hypothetical protein